MDGDVMLPEYSLKIGPQDLQVLVAALHDQPYKVVAALLNRLQAQVSDQEAAGIASAQASDAASA